MRSLGNNGYVKGRKRVNYNRRFYVPRINGAYAHFPDGSVYEMRQDGWRRIRDD